jgi:archaellum component FlaC
MATIELLKITRDINDKAKGVDERVEGVDDRVRGVSVKVEAVDEKVQSIDSKVQCVGHDVGSVIKGRLCLSWSRSSPDSVLIHFLG